MINTGEKIFRLPRGAMIVTQIPCPYCEKRLFKSEDIYFCTELKCKHNYEVLKSEIGADKSNLAGSKRKKSNGAS